METSFLQFYERVLDVMPVGVVLTNPRLKDNPIVYVNKAFLDLTGYAKNEVIYRNCRFLQGADRGQEEIEQLREAISRKESCCVTLRNYRKGGQLFWNRLTIAPIFDEHGELIYYVGVQEDVTKEMLALREVELSREKIINAAKEWRRTVDVIPDMIFLTDASGNILRCNNAFAKFFNLPYEEVINQNISRFFSDSASDNFCFEKALHSRGGEFNLGDRVFEIRNYQVERGKVWLHIARDISREKAEQIEMKRLREAFEHSTEAIVITDENGLVQQVNPAFERLTLWKKEDVLGKHFMVLSSVDDYTEILDSIRSGKSWIGQLESKRKDGEVYLEEMSISPILDDFGKVTSYVVLKRDVTTQKKMENIMASINLAENIGYAFMSLRHELGNPINTIKTILSILEKRIENWEKEKIQDYIKRSLDEIARIEYLLGILKSFGLNETIQRRPVKAKEFFERFLKTTKEDFEVKGVEIRSYVSDVQFLADERALHQVMLNLFSNALDALESKENPTITLRVKKSYSFVEISVEDNGIGMTKEQMDNLFKPFYTTKQGGSGIGLSVVKSMVSKMFGTIEVESEYGKGTKVKMFLEAYDEDTSG